MRNFLLKLKCFKNAKLKSNHQFNFQLNMAERSDPSSSHQPLLQRRFAFSLCCVVQLSIGVDGIKINHNLCPLGLKLPAKTLKIQ